MQQMSCNFMFIVTLTYQIVRQHKCCTHGTDLCSVTENLAKSEGISGRNTSRQQELCRSRCPLPYTRQDHSRAENEAWVSRQIYLCSVLVLNLDMTLTGSSSARQQQTFDFTNVLGNLWPSVKGICEWRLKSDLLLTQV